jgi:thiamine-monophosphate kinase
MASRRRVGEFELIARYFAPLARSFAGAGGLESDNAFLPADARHDIAVKTDTIVSGVHFLGDESPRRVAAKALRVCLSDLAAGGASRSPINCRLPSKDGRRWVAFARRRPISSATASLCGGDIVVPGRSPSPLPPSAGYRRAGDWDAPARGPATSSGRAERSATGRSGFWLHAAN